MSKIYVVGIGPGAYEQMTIKAAQILRDCDVIVGYTVYVDLVKEHFKEKEFLTTPMTKEIKRCEMAFEKAAEGKRVAMICSGDAGVYGLSGLMLEIGNKYPGITVEVVPGVTAAISGAALLGAPLIHDFALISLSDRMTPWETIANRLLLAARADLVICLYNPASKKRHDYLKRACELLLRHKDGNTICATAEQIGRSGENKEIYTLKELRAVRVNMFTSVFIGNSQTVMLNGNMVTPRGYRL